VKAPIDAPFNQTDELEKFPKMLDYGREHGSLQCIAFEKYDGSNFGWRWDGQTFSKPFVRSGKSFDYYDPIAGPSLGIFDRELKSRLAQLLAGVSEAIVFTEYYGPKTYAGNHVEGDEMRLVPIDLWKKGLGFTPPDEFSKLFPETRVVYRGKLSTQFVEDVRKGRLGVNEGVVCKGGTWGSVWYCKIKTDAWLAKGGEP